MNKRKIKDILHFRRDIPPFLVHLTRKNEDKNNLAKDNLIRILDSKTLIQSQELISDIRFGGDCRHINNAHEFLSSICVTETPLESIHCLIDIQGRKVNLESYGIVFLKENLKKENFSPVLYFNNFEKGIVDDILQSLFSITNGQLEVAKKFLPLVSTFGNSVKKAGEYDFYWEREWRRPFTYGDFQFDLEKVFCGLCPEEDIGFFEDNYPGLPFVDPIKPPSWYASKLIQRRKELKMEHSVV